MLVGHPSHTMTLAGMETADADREAARQLAQAEELTAAMRQPRASISAKANRQPERIRHTYNTVRKT